MCFSSESISYIHKIELYIIHMYRPHILRIQENEIH
jgi:hypothetical protein